MKKTTSFFCNLELRNFTSNITPKIQKDDGTLITKQNEILSEPHSFYQNLYSEQKHITDVNLPDLIINENTKNLQMKHLKILKVL